MRRLRIRQHLLAMPRWQIGCGPILQHLLLKIQTTCRVGCGPIRRLLLRRVPPPMTPSRRGYGMMRPPLLLLRRAPLPMTPSRRGYGMMTHLLLRPRSQHCQTGCGPISRLRLRLRLRLLLHLRNQHCQTGCRPMPRLRPLLRLRLRPPTRTTFHHGCRAIPMNRSLRRLALVMQPCLHGCEVPTLCRRPLRYLPLIQG
jgi:hypothetical protein